MRALAAIGVAIVTLAACGGSTVSVGDQTAADGGGGASSGATPCPGTQAPECPWGTCLDGPRATCSQGEWVCPLPPSSCSAQCSGKKMPDCKCGTPVCAYGSWQCPGSCADAGADAGADAAVDAGPDANATFPCGGIFVCHSATQYCKVGVGGPPGGQPSYACEPIPASCASDVSCACIKTAVGGQLCTDADGVTVTFEYP